MENHILKEKNSQKDGENTTKNDELQEITTEKDSFKEKCLQFEELFKISKEENNLSDMSNQEYIKHLNSKISE